MTSPEKLTDSPTLLPCPFCGRHEFATIRKHLVQEPGEEDFHWGYNVICSAAGIAGTRGCGVTNGWAETVDEAIEAWNRRTPIESSTEPVAWIPQAHLDFLKMGVDGEGPSSAIVHDRPNEEMGWTIPLYLAAPVSVAPAVTDEQKVKAEPLRGDELRSEDEGVLSVAKTIYLEMGLKHAASNITLDQSWDMSPHLHAECIERAKSMIARSDFP